MNGKSDKIEILKIGIRFKQRKQKIVVDLES